MQTLFKLDRNEVLSAVTGLVQKQNRGKKVTVANIAVSEAGEITAEATLTAIPRAPRKAKDEAATKAPKVAAKK